MSSGKRSLRPPVDRYSITKFSPSMYPYSRNVLRKTFMLGALSSRDALSSTPIRQILSGCCACALIGSTAAALSAAMNSRRLMGLTLGPGSRTKYSRDPAEFAKPLHKGGGPLALGCRRGRAQVPDARQLRWLLRARRQRPRHCGPAEERDELAAFHCPVPPVLRTEGIAHRDGLVRCGISARLRIGSDHEPK